MYRVGSRPGYLRYLHEARDVREGDTALYESLTECLRGAKPLIA